MAQHKTTFLVETDQPLQALVAAHVDPNAAPILIRRGAVWVDRRRVLDPALVAHHGAQIEIHFPPSGRYDTVALTPGDVLWEDNVLLAINKRPGWHTNYNPWDMWGSLRHALGAWLQARDGIEYPVHLLHQLDRDTSGVLLASKSPSINSRMQQLFLNGEIGKTYLALASGRVEATTLDIETGHGRGQSGLFRVYPLEDVGRVLPFGKQRVRHMLTRFEVVERFDHATLLRALPITGRTHQIRLHLQHIGHPILGDARYGGATTLGCTSIGHHLLHAAQLRLPHPVTSQPLRLDAPLPPLWLRVLDMLHQKR
jgi:23S rRNA pseudouridine1911/1915/1917 synthase